MPASPLDDFYAAIHDVPDFPTPGVVFRDITPLLADPVLFRRAITRMADPFRDSGITKVLGIESRGFILGGPISLELGAGLVPARKEGKLPRERHRVEYTLEYGNAAIEVHTDAVDEHDRARAACDTIAMSGGTVAGFSFLIEIAPLDGRAKLPGDRLEALIVYPRPA